MHLFLIVCLFVILGAVGLSLLARRFSENVGTGLSLVAGLVGRIAAAVVATGLTASAIHHGGWFNALAVLFAILGLAALAMSALSVATLVMMGTGRLRD